ncbi:hypothetical protein AAW01_02100 [Aurantiacibacter gangjinensis]|uniref:Phage holin family protein n=1 Tax=Aurantiacibacter gangjinensis TaxID=502682 RepID=A0A0G9MSF9_9SPHN|nr:hypothetical protein AAW01_02100 [Aurantiacibacter gangjinensis]
METPHDPAAPLAEEHAGSRSLLDDIEALYDDARLYLDAELSYQKTRAGFVADRVKKTIAFAVVAAFIAVLATIGLTVGLIIALTPLITAWGATAVVVLGLLLIAYLLVRKAGKTWNGMMAAMNSEEEEMPDDG